MTGAAVVGDLVGLAVVGASVGADVGAQVTSQHVDRHLLAIKAAYSMCPGQHPLKP